MYTTNSAMTHRSLGDCLNALQACDQSLTDTLQSLSCLTTDFSRTRVLLKQVKSAEYVPDSSFKRLQTTLDTKMTPALKQQVEWLEEALIGVQDHHTMLEMKVNEKMELSLGSEAQEETLQRYRNQISAAQNKLMEEQTALESLKEEISDKQHELDEINHSEYETQRLGPKVNPRNQRRIDELQTQLRTIEAQLESTASPKPRYKSNVLSPTLSHGSRQSSQASVVPDVLQVLQAHSDTLATIPAGLLENDDMQDTLAALHINFDRLQTALWPQLEEHQRAQFKRLEALLKLCYPTENSTMAEILDLLLMSDNREVVFQTLAESFAKRPGGIEKATRVIKLLCDLGITETAIEVADSAKRAYMTRQEYHTIMLLL
ncbi:hypothetical protein BJ085DRAFT_31237 [Dimargaris cristalligena]|uniref:Uncharacterized protein n=1 Tax=Dimargaris cristalligena TaxID=215637 RepID=A0A4Q0A2Y2_9FUNG|nr:hypothetical protein BJ085DRAFT_31237 [Dimargaris cristalligena]|eukprot:RKP39560.1 hypothetical protein BJ085DRAFT_31237 [Dimargaris cristalligena]